MLTFKKIRDEILKEISLFSGYEEKLLNNLLLSDCNDKKSEFVIWFTKLSNENIAEKIADKIKLSKHYLIKDVQASNNRLSIYIDKRKLLSKIIKTIEEENDQYGTNTNGSNKKIVVEYSSPNIAKKFHVGHFRNTILGNFIVKLCQANGYKTVSINYLGDWGKQFGLILTGLDLFGDKEKLKKDPLNHLFEVYVKTNNEMTKEIEARAHEINKAMEEGINEEYLRRWKELRDLSIDKLKKLYKMLNIEFDVYSGESFYVKSGKEVIDKIDFYQQDEDGSRFIDCDCLGRVVVQRKDGTSIYISRDIASDIDRFKKYDPHLIIHCVASEQDLHFKQLFWIINRMGYDVSKLRHVNYGLVTGMSTRAGNVHFIEDVISRSKECMLQYQMNDDVDNKEETASILALSFLIIEDFSAKRLKGYTFDIEKRAKTKKGESLGPNIQYTHCRLASIERQNSNIDLTDVDYSLIEDDSVCNLAYKLLWYQNIIEISFNDFEPCKIVSYLQDICKSVNNLIPTLRVKDAELNIAKARLMILKSTRIVIGNALKLLGLTPLNKM
ncbi:SYR [Hepatospora eriocheir]|uniref:arginine--tRNA ligase n=2 Tax=Hepatospora eriocheir TaxID=1081669 RepID=A0A1X0QJ73_9MICR|nr:arginyl tRNA synthetase [Hepatospora eriocheir 'edible crab parasite']ORD99755.1 SYR [Hepatospora eriocheir]